MAITKEQFALLYKTGAIKPKLSKTQALRNEMAKRVLAADKKRIKDEAKKTLDMLRNAVKEDTKRKLHALAMEHKSNKRTT